MITDTLLERCARQETKAQYELYRELYPLMMSICTRYERNRQDSTARMNQGFLKILQNLDKRRPEVPFDAWVRRIMINTVIDGFRRDRDRRSNETEERPVNDVHGAEINDYLKHMEAEAFARLLQQVPSMSRNVFNLFAVDGFAHAEIADILGISVGTSKWHVSNARDILQQAIAKLAVTMKSTVR
ncbi:MAG: sigma-70 family RNA polymerase sigma factor [Flavobacteriales bacterium]|nr:sigma-70 family RNA polymerase sigma factor [Flavobacteriales bacterium]